MGLIIRSILKVLLQMVKRPRMTRLRMTMFIRIVTRVILLKNRRGTGVWRLMNTLIILIIGNRWRLTPRKCFRFAANRPRTLIGKRLFSRVKRTPKMIPKVVRWHLTNGMARERVVTRLVRLVRNVVSFGIPTPTKKMMVVMLARCRNLQKMFKVVKLALRLRVR